jgi:hypothetical protein
LPYLFFCQIDRFLIGKISIFQGEIVEKGKMGEKMQEIKNTNGFFSLNFTILKTPPFME